MTKLGVYVGNDTNDLTVYEAWLGNKVDQVLFYLNDWSWKDFDSSIGWATDLWKTSGRPVIWSVPLTVTGTPLNEVASGAYNDHFLKAAQALAHSQASEDGYIYVRVGWEFNGTWMPWAAKGNEVAFIDAYHQLVDTFRSVSGQFKFVWDVNEGGTYDPVAAYPGDNYVDVVGIDFYYNKQWNPADPAAAFEEKINQAYGLQWQQDFAAAHGKATAISEWGVQTDDAGAFVKAAAEWMGENKILFNNYWESDYANFNGTLHDNSKPNVSVAFKEAFTTYDPLTSESGLGNEREDDNDALFPDVSSTLGVLTVRVSADSFNGDPQFIVTVDGKQIGGVQTATASHADGKYQDLVLKGNFKEDANLVKIEFINDHFNGVGQDRNLYIHQIGIGGKNYAGDEAINNAGLNVGGKTGMFYNGSATFKTGQESTSNELTLKMSADTYQGGAQFMVTVDGQKIGDIQTVVASHGEGQHEYFRFEGEIGRNPSEIHVTFLNDFYEGAGKDRNLYIETLTINGHTIDGSEAHNGAGWNPGHTAGLFSDGSVVFIGQEAGWLI